MRLSFLSKDFRGCKFLFFSIALLALVMHSVSVSAQSSFGGHPFKVEWYQINTDQVRVIYPDSLEEKAQRVANIIHYMNNNNVGLLGEKRRKVDVILQNQQAISNGFAQVAPFKTEFFLQAPQNTFEESSVDWTDQLALHEYRHVNQFVNQKKGIGHLFSWLFGDYGWAGMLGVSAPAWFLEGDATINETALSSGGRGRVPSFSSFQRAMLEEEVQYSYMKAHNGSFKDYVPNHYNMGYLILSEIRREHGNKSFDRITSDAARLKGIIYPFSKAVKRETGKKVKDHYFSAQSKLAESIPKIETPGQRLTSGIRNDVTHYNHPIVEDDVIYFHKRSRRHLAGIYKLQEDQETLVVNQGIILDEHFSKNGNQYAWVELQRDIRRGNQNYSNIILYDEGTKTKRIIGEKQRYFSPSFSPDGVNLIFVNATTLGSSGISMMNIETNALLEIAKSSEIQFFYPVIDRDQKFIYAFVKKGQKFAMAKLSLEGELELLTEWDNKVFGPLRMSEEHVIFHANYGGVDNVFALELQTDRLMQVSNDPIGLYNPSNLENGIVVAARPSSKGFMLQELHTNPENWMPTATQRSREVPYYLETEHLEPVDILSEIGDYRFTTEPYPGTAKMLNPHSWYVEADGNQVSASVVSTNVLNNIEITPSYTYFNSVNRSFVSFSALYGKWFPFYVMQYSYEIPRIRTLDDGRSFNSNQQTITPSIIVPLTLTRGLYSSSISFNNSVSLNFDRNQEISTMERFDFETTVINNSISYQRTRLRPLQNYYPRWGINSVIRNRHRTNDSHNAFNIANDLYVPGFHVNHGFKFEVDFAMKNEIGEIQNDLVDVFNYANGFRSVDFDNIIGINTNYGMPVAYPDLGIWDFIYFKRINAVLFHNYNRISFENQSSNIQSIGADVLFDLVFINNVFSEISVGFRNAYMIGQLPEGKSIPYHFEFIIDIPAF